MKHTIPQSYRHIRGIEKYQTALSRLCHTVYEKNMSRAQEEFLALIEAILADCQDDDRHDHTLSALCDILYSEFNEYFAAWMKEQGFPPPYSPFRTTLSHCFLDTAPHQRELEDIMWEVCVHILNTPRPQNHQEIREKITTLRLSSAAPSGE